MDHQSLSTVLAIVGTLGVIGLGVNGYFLRGIFKDLNDLRVDFATIAANGRAKAQQIAELKENEKEIFQRLNILEKK